MSRSIVLRMYSRVPEDSLAWVDSSVLSAVPVVDNEYIESFRRHHRVCSSRDDEEKYEIVASDPEDRICFGELLTMKNIFFSCMTLCLPDLV